MELSWRTLFLILSITMLVCIVSAVWIDRPLALYMDRYVSNELKTTFRYVTKLGKGEYLCVLVALVGTVAWLAYRYGRRSSRFALAVVHTTVFILICELVSAAAVHALKLIFGRQRPRLLFYEDIYGFIPFSGSDSFPSGHTQVVVAGLLPIALAWPALRIPACVVIVLVAVSRIILNMHYLSDVIASVVITSLCVLWLRDWFMARHWLCAPPGFQETYVSKSNPLRGSLESLRGN